jgi:drug/metabolite transporter superfamily protein YnfA
MQTAIVLVGAALLEVSGLALIRMGLRMGLRERPLFFFAGALTLIIYGVVVNQGRFDFGRLTGAYIAVFFLVSQVIALAFFRDTPDYKTLAGGLLIVLGGAVIML